MRFATPCNVFSLGNACGLQTLQHIAPERPACDACSLGNVSLSLSLSLSLFLSRSTGVSDPEPTATNPQCKHPGLWSLISDLWSLVSGLWSRVSGGCVGRSVGRWAGRSVDVVWSSGRLVDWPASRSAGRPAGQPAGRPADRPTDRPADRPTDRPTDRSMCYTCSLFTLVLLFCWCCWLLYCFCCLLSY